MPKGLTIVNHAFQQKRNDYHFEKTRFEEIHLNWFAFLSFAFVAIFTPGANNIIATEMGINYGYRKSLKMIFGIVCGFELILLITNIFTVQLYLNLPFFKSFVGFVGAAYLLFLAFKIATDSGANKGKTKKGGFGFLAGFSLQFLNPKAVIFALTVNSVYIVPNSSSFVWGFSYFVAILIMVFVAVSAWTLFGQTISRFLKNTKIRMSVNIFLALLLVYAAYSVLQM